MEKLTYLPLAIIQSASFLNMTQRSLQTYLELLGESEEEVVKLLSENFEDPTRYPNAINPVAITGFISFDHISKNHVCAADILSYMTCLHEKNVTRSLLPDVGSELEAISAITVLEGHSFLARQRETNSFKFSDELYNMHRLVQLATRNWLNMKNKLIDCTIACLRRVEQLFPGVSHESKIIWTLYAPHGQRLCVDEAVEDLPERYNLLQKMGWCYFYDGKYNDAVKTQSAVVAWRENKTGIAEEQILEAYESLGVALDWQGDWSRAEMYLQQALDRRMELFGRSHFQTLESQAKLAAIYLSQGRLEEAEELLVQVVIRRLHAFGEDDFDTLSYQNNLALVYDRQGRRKEAEGLYKRILQTRQRVLGHAHPDTLIGQDNLASTYWSQGRLKEAEELNVQILKKMQQVLGHEHPNTLISQHNLADTLKCLGRTSESINLLTPCLEISLRTLGAGHPDTSERKTLLEIWLQEQQDTAKPPDHRIGEVSSIVTNQKPSKRKRSALEETCL